MLTCISVCLFVYTCCCYSTLLMLYFNSLNNNFSEILLLLMRPRRRRRRRRGGQPGQIKVLAEAIAKANESLLTMRMMKIVLRKVMRKMTGRMTKLRRDSPLMRRRASRRNSMSRRRETRRCTSTSGRGRPARIRKRMRRTKIRFIGPM